MLSHHCASLRLEKKGFSSIVDIAMESTSNFSTISSHVLDFMRSDVSKLLVPPCHIHIIRYSVDPDSIPGLNKVGMVTKRKHAIRGNSHSVWKVTKIALVSIKFGSPVHAFRKCIRIAWRKIEFFRIFEVDHRAFVQLNEFI